jgi:hypothetical protein
MHSQNIEDILAGPDIKQRTVGESQAKANRTSLLQAAEVYGRTDSRAA